jgi:ribosome modulation factor
MTELETAYSVGKAMGNERICASECPYSSYLQIKMWNRGWRDGLRERARRIDATRGCNPYEDTGEQG